MTDHKDLTPAHLKCAISISCPSIHRLEDGRLLVVGENAVAKAIDIKNQPLGDNELAIVISEDLLSELKKEWVREALANPSDAIIAAMRDAYNVDVLGFEKGTVHGKDIEALVQDDVRKLAAAAARAI